MADFGSALEEVSRNRFELTAQYAEKLARWASRCASSCAPRAR